MGKKLAQYTYYKYGKITYATQAFSILLQIEKKKFLRSWIKLEETSSMKKLHSDRKDKGKGLRTIQGVDYRCRSKV